MDTTPHTGAKTTCVEDNERLRKPHAFHASGESPQYHDTQSHHLLDRRWRQNHAQAHSSSVREIATPRPTPKRYGYAFQQWGRRPCASRARRRGGNAAHVPRLAPAKAKHSPEKHRALPRLPPEHRAIRARSAPPSQGRSLCAPRG